MTKKVNLTPLRKQVLKIAWQQHEPIGAYEILAELAKNRDKPAPQTIYRALEFLRQVGLVHRLDTPNAFLGCDRPEDAHAGQFLVCSRWVAEIEDAVLSLGARPFTPFSLRRFPGRNQGSRPLISLLPPMDSAVLHYVHSVIQKRCHVPQRQIAQ